MKFTDITRRAARNLRQAKGRTILTSLAISVGAFTITMALAAGAGGRNYVEGIVSTTGDTESLQIFPRYENPYSAASEGPQKYDTEAVETQKNNETMALDADDIKAIKVIDGVESVTPMFSVSVDYITAANGEKYVTPIEVKADKTALELKAGSLDGNRLKEGFVTIPDTYVKSLGFKNAEAAIGKSVTLHITKAPTGALTEVPESRDVTLTIQAVDTEGKDSLLYSKAVRISPADAESMYRYQEPEGSADSYYGVSAQVAPGKNVKEVQDAVDAKGYTVYSLQDAREAMFTAVNVAMAGLAGFGALAILASIFGIINTMYISVLERTQQIGLMKALGMRSKDVGRLFRYEAAWIGFLGGAIGAGLAIILGVIANPVIDEALSLGGKSLLVFEPLSVAIIIASLVLVAVISGIFPSRKAAKLDPIEALRTE